MEKCGYHQLIQCSRSTVIIVIEYLWSSIFSGPPQNRWNARKVGKLFKICWQCDIKKFYAIHWHWTMCLLHAHESGCSDNVFFSPVNCLNHSPSIQNFDTINMLKQEIWYKRTVLVFKTNTDKVWIVLLENSRGTEVRKWLYLRLKSHWIVLSALKLYREYRHAFSCLLRKKYSFLFMKWTCTRNPLEYAYWA